MYVTEIWVPYSNPTVLHRSHKPAYCALFVPLPVPSNRKRQYWPNLHLRASNFVFSLLGKLM